VYITCVSKQYSIANARKNLPSLLDQVEAGAEVELTRRGQPIAVVVSVAELQRLKGQRMRFGEALAAFQSKFPAALEDYPARTFRGLRERGAGRPVKL
jgi:prevent-host-death family protein